jgi:D-alanine-D-alanine ligase-like ATP-grasp enzyme
MAQSMERKRRPGTTIVGEIFAAVAPRIGAKILFEPEWGVAGQITFSNGRRRYFRFSSIDLNPLASSDLAKDKAFSNFFMGAMGYRTIEGQTFFSDDWAAAIGSNRTMDAAWAYAQQLGMPVFVKPNSGSQGRGVAKVHDETAFVAAMQAIFRIDRVALVQRAERGDDYRIVVLDDRVISAYRRIPLSVVGDGRHSIDELVTMKQLDFDRSGRDTRIKRDDPRIDGTLGQIGLAREHVPRKDQRIFLLSNSNLSSGGEAADVTESMHSTICDLAIRLTRDMGLRLCGVDILLDGSVTHELDEYRIVEINAAPGLDHYASSGPKQRKIVEDLYLEILKGMAREGAR